MGQSFVVARLATASWADNHETMAHSRSIVQLDDLLYEGALWLQIQFFRAHDKLLQKSTKINFWLLDTWEQVRDDVLEQW